MRNKMTCIVKIVLPQGAPAPMPTGETFPDFHRKMANDPPPDQPKEVPMIGG